jgi:transcriptional regulator with XRE-family HTH domain
VVVIPRPNGAELGQAIRRRRHERKMTIEDLAFDADIHPTYLSGIERGGGNPTWDKLAGIAYALEMPVSSLARDAEVEAQLAQRMRDARRELGGA